MGKVYQSVRGVVQGTLHRRKPDILVSIQPKDDNDHLKDDAAPLNDAIQELEKIFVDRIGGLKAALSDNQAVVASKAQHAEQVIEDLKANITALEAKLRDTEDILHKKTVANQTMEESLNSEIRDLQSVVKEKEEALQSRDSEVNDLKSNRDVLAEQISRLELTIQQAKGEAATKARHTEQVIDGLKANITTLEAKLQEAKDALNTKDLANQKIEESLNNEIRNLQSVVKQKEEALKTRDSEVNDLKSNRDVLAEQITRLELAIQQAKEEAASKPQHADQIVDSLKANIAMLQPPLTETEQIVVAANHTTTRLGEDRDNWLINLNAELRAQMNRIKKVAGATSVASEAASDTVSQDDFARVTAEFSKFTNVMGSIASLIVRDHVRALGESMEQFPQKRLADLLDSLSGQITDDKLRADFLKGFGKG